MKTIVRPIEMVSVTDLEGMIKPIRFRITGKDEEVNVVKILKIYSVDKARIAGVQTRIYRCEILVGEAVRLCELRYSIESTRWELYKI